MKSGNISRDIYQYVTIASSLFLKQTSRYKYCKLPRSYLLLKHKHTEIQILQTSSLLNIVKTQKHRDINLANFLAFTYCCRKFVFQNATGLFGLWIAIIIGRHIKTQSYVSPETPSIPLLPTKLHQTKYCQTFESQGPYSWLRGYNVLCIRERNKNTGTELLDQHSYTEWQHTDTIVKKTF